MIELIFASKLERDAHIAETINGFVKLVEEMVDRHPEDAGLLAPGQSSSRSGNTRRSGSIVQQITNTREEPANAASDCSRKTIEAAGSRPATRRLPIAS